VPPGWTAIPFAGMLLSIALVPLAAGRFWERHHDKVALAWCVTAAVLMAGSVPAGRSFGALYGAKTAATLHDYVSFLILLGTLYIVTGGIHVSGDLKGTPGRNTGMLLLGSILANVIGTTGAAMLLVRPLIRANARRRSQAHVMVFFIFLVCNIGGVLSPIGDPPLFLGFLAGVPFFWTLKLFPLWSFCVIVVLFAFYSIDETLVRREGLPDEEPGEPIRVQGGINALVLLGVIGTIVLSGALHTGVGFSLFGLTEVRLEDLLRDFGQAGLAGVSLLVTPRAVRQENGFSYGPLREVGVLFIGIFVTMIPAVMVLNARGGELGLTSPLTYFWASGLLSSFLDNAPTYLTFLAAAQGQVGAAHASALTESAAGELLLTAVSAGSVFMGANSYIGNGPNFMVKSVAERMGVRMPTFFGYMGWSCLILLPLFGLVTLIFLR
jgi:Na+/H+ antiporter NhaD/arsenite permease-like protein